MLKLESLVQYLDEYLGVADHPDFANALNGLQVDRVASGGAKEIATVAIAVDASLASIDEAAASGADLLIVHHGLFWDGLTPLVGRHFERVKRLLDANMALYSCHLPLDAHAEVGNCALLAKAAGLRLEGRIGRYQDADLGWWGRLPEPAPVATLVEAVSGAIGGGPVRTLSGGPDQVESVGVVTGGGASFVRAASEAGLDAFVTGEGSHHTYFDAAEFGIHVLFAGHYATETFGVKALGAHLSERFGLASHFVDQPTGL